MTAAAGQLTAAQLAVLQEALGDAYAYRVGESGREDLADLEEPDREAAQRYEAVAAELGWGLN